jgi:tRNA nucleotidyltransferase/poly(A) polymerase
MRRQRRDAEHHASGRWVHLLQGAPAPCRIQALGLPAMIAGGAVRDLLLGRVPRDVDVVAAAGTRELLALFPGGRVMQNGYGTVEVAAAGPRSAAVQVTPLRQFGAAPAGSFWDVNLGRRARPAELPYRPWVATV